MKKVVISTLSEETLTQLEEKFEDMGIDIEEIRYDLLYRRYEIYVKVSILQSYRIRRFMKSLDVDLYLEV